MTTAKGIDVSSWQHPSGAAIDWEQVKASGVTFVMVKATQGTDYTNPYANGPLAHDITDALAAGLLVGAYHFARPGPDTAEAEAAYFLAAVEGLKLDMGLWLDLEDLGGKMPHEVVPYRDVFLTAIVTHNALSGIYTDKSLVAQGLGAPAGSRLWLANPTPEPGDPESFITQTGSGLVDGVTGSVDLDTLN
ncbi:MAG: glycoside hydrolase family 25 protein, partial [Candidatus Dormibacteria bacterium]